MTVDIDPYIDAIQGDVVLEGSSSEEDGKHISLEDSTGTRIALYTKLESNGYKLNNIVIRTPRIPISTDAGLHKKAHSLLEDSDIKVVLESSSGTYYESQGQIDSDIIKESEEVVKNTDDIWVRFVHKTDTSKTEPEKAESLRQRMTDLHTELLDKRDA